MIAFLTNQMTPTAPAEMPSEGGGILGDEMNDIRILVKELVDTAHHAGYYKGKGARWHRDYVIALGLRKARHEALIAIIEERINQERPCQSD